MVCLFYVCLFDSLVGCMSVCLVGWLVVCNLLHRNRRHAGEQGSKADKASMEVSKEEHNKQNHIQTKQD